MNKSHRPILAALLLAACSGNDDSAAARAELAEVVKGPFPISVTASGEIKAAKSTLVKNDMEGSSTIIDLIEEGSIVKKGDILVELDASSQIERRATQEIAVEKANAAVINAEKSLEILIKQIDTDILAAKNTWNFAKMDKDKFYGAVLENGQREMGEKEQSIIAEEAEIALARSALKLAEDKYNWSLKLRAKDFITKEALDQDHLDYQSKKTKVALAINKLDILKKYTHIKIEQELDQAEKVAKIEYDRAIAKGEAELTQARADLAAKKKEAELAAERLQNLETQIKSATVRAPTPGIVVYASEGDRFRRRTVEIGTQVRERQSLIILPDTSEMHAELKIQEVMIDKIRPGLPALVRIDTTDKPLTGKVLRRAPLPDSGSRGSNPDLKVYKTTIAIDGNNEDNTLHPNMSATIEIIIARLEDVLSVPQTAVFSDRAVQYVWLHRPEGPVPTKVTVGENNETRVVITAGLSAGQLVYLVQPPGMSAPEFDQPQSQGDATAQLEVPREIPSAEGREGGGRGGRGGNREGGNREGGGRGRRNGVGRNNPAMAAFRKASDDFKAVVKAENPELHARIEEAGFRWATNPEITQAIEAAPKLAEAFAAYQAAMRQMRMNRERDLQDDGEGGDGEGGGRRGRGGPEGRDGPGGGRGGPGGGRGGPGGGRGGRDG